MTTYYLWAGAAGTASGADWTNAFDTLTEACTAATTSGDVIKVHKAHVEDIGAATTYTFANNVSVICVDKDASDALATMDGTSYYIGRSDATTYYIRLAGAYRVYFYGIAFRVSGTGSGSLTPSYTDGAHMEFEACKLWVGTGATQTLTMGQGNTTNEYVKLYGGTEVKFGHASQSILIAGGGGELNEVTIAGTAPTALFTTGSYSFGPVNVEACDLSLVTGTILNGTTQTKVRVDLVNCKLGSGVTLYGTASPTNLGAGEVRLFNCDSGDNHYKFAHQNAFGLLTVDTSIYANDGAKYDGTNYCSWKIVTTANCSFYTPYVSPWFGRYHSGTSAISPYVEILRDGSATAYQDDEVWAEFSYQGTTGYPQAVLVSDRMTVLGTPADQAAGVGVSGWTGENATSWSGKCVTTATITPAEIGHIMARLCVGEPSITVYADPAVRGTS